MWRLSASPLLLGKVGARVWGGTEEPPPALIQQLDDDSTNPFKTQILGTLSLDGCLYKS